MRKLVAWLVQAAAALVSPGFIAVVAYAASAVAAVIGSNMLFGLGVAYLVAALFLLVLAIVLARGARS